MMEEERRNSRMKNKIEKELRNKKGRKIEE